MSADEGALSRQANTARDDARAASDRGTVLIDFALQGGGSHGAFTWGVLDRLLEEPWLRVDGISGTSAGAMNAAVLADGHAEGGADGGRAALERFWRRVSHAALLSPFRRGPLDALLGRWTLDSSPAYLLMDFASRVFRNAEVTPDVLLASACLPTMFQAVEIGGEAYWDGGYAGNPTITPLVRECTSRDTLLVQVNPVERPGTPRLARDILNRLNEVSFNSV